MQRTITPILVGLVVLLSLMGHVSATKDQASEKNFVRSLYTALNKQFDPTADPCTYDGVTCSLHRNSPARVSYKIDLSGRDLKATRLPEAIDAELDIYEIDLSGNRGIKVRLPDSWSSLTFLEKLDLSATGIYGAIPNSWKSMHKIRYINLSNCFLCYSVPDWSLEDMPELKDINLSGNQLSYLSAAFGSFSLSTVIESVNIKDNLFCNCLPKTWFGRVLGKAAREAGMPESDRECAGLCKGKPVCLTEAAMEVGISHRLVVALVAALVVLGAMY